MRLHFNYNNLLFTAIMKPVMVKIIVVPPIVMIVAISLYYSAMPNNSPYSYSTAKDKWPNLPFISIINLVIMDSTLSTIIVSLNFYF